MRLTKTLTAVFAVLAIGLMGLATVPAQNLPPTWVFARAYNYSPIVGQQANTYSWNGLVCNYSPATGGNSASFFVFSGYLGSTKVYNPVFINDVNPAENEIVTPSATTNGASTCGFNASPANSHTSFSVQSGTAGLQEAIENQYQSPAPSQVLLDPYWFNQIAALPGNLTPHALITGATGAATVAVVDTTTAPWTSWRWNGTTYVISTGSLSGGTPTPAAGAGAGTSPTIACGSTCLGSGFTVDLTEGSAPPTTGTLFTVTFSSNGNYQPACQLASTGSTPFTAFTITPSVSSSHPVLTVALTGTAPTAAASYVFTGSCQ